MNRRELIHALIPIVPIVKTEIPKPSELKQDCVYLFVVNDDKVSGETIENMANSLGSHGIRGTISYVDGEDAPAFTIYELHPCEPPQDN